MNKFFVGEYINRLKRDDIYNFALKQGVILTDDEVGVIYEYVKKYYTYFFDGREDVVFERLRPLIRTFVYDKIIELYNKYKDMYRK